jgi:HEAT repeat protein
MVEAQPLRAQVEAELLVSDGAPELDALAKLGARGDLAALLAEIAADAAEPPLARHRALALIAEFPSPRGRELLTRLKSDAPAPYTRTVAARALERLRAGQDAQE